MRILGVQRSGMAPVNIGRWEALLANDVEVGLICARAWPEGGMDIRASEVTTSVRMYPMATIPKGWGPYYLYLPGFSRVVRDFRPDLIHFREEVFTVCAGEFLAQRRLRFGGTPFIFESHQNIRKRYPWPARSFEAAAYSATSGAIAGTDAIAEVMKLGGYKGELSVIPLGGIDLESFSPEGPDLKASLPSGRLVGYVGRLAPEKGLDTLIKALSLIPGRATLVMVGDGPSRLQVQELARSLQVEVHLTGPLPQQQLPALFRSLDVLVLPSLTTAGWKEQWGRVLTEAMACGTPVIGSDSGEIPAVIADAGIVFSEGREEELAQALGDLSTDPNLAERLRRSGLERVKEFTWDKHAARTIDFYRKVLGSR